MKVGLVGFAGSGKSTVFEWLSGERPDPAKVQQGQTAMVDVPDDRLRAITARYRPKKPEPVFAKLALLDTPGLLTEERKDNPRRLALIREAGAMVVVLDGFSRRDWVDQWRRFREECLLADLEVVSNRISRLELQLKKRARPPKEIETDEAELRLLQRIGQALEQGQPASALGLNPDEEKMVRSFQLLTLKPEIVLINRGETPIEEPELAELKRLSPTVLHAPAKLELELQALSEDDRRVFMQELGLQQLQREEVIRGIFYEAGRQVFFTVGEDECRSWAIPVGATALEAAACIHTDLAEKFVRANVISYADFLACGYSEKEAKTRGLMRTEGKTYIVQDGDVIHILASS
ncbi:MAG: ribosome-binding ATPase YchF [Gemmataceae bacterium]|jgi:ribosome-binding ATPase YchF (GTP1/OBG family)|nr:MAG: ribosome-binding ATPase YchF [Gemmataceae bacterium]